MPCKIQIKDNITDVVIEQTDHVLDQTLPIAKAVGDEVNAGFGADVVSFSERNNNIVRDIHIPSELVDEYYDHELGVEEEAESVPAIVGEDEGLQYKFRSVDKITNNIDKINQWFKQLKDTDGFWNKLQKDLQIPKDQIELIRKSKGDTPGEKLASFAAEHSYTIETTEASQTNLSFKPTQAILRDEYDSVNAKEKFDKSAEGDYYVKQTDDAIYYKRLTPDGERHEKVVKVRKSTPSVHYSYLTVPGGTTYREHEIVTPDITPNIKGHADFATKKGIGWFRSDEQITSEYPITQGTTVEEMDGMWVVTAENIGIIQDFYTKEEAYEFLGAQLTNTRRVLEVQSDLFQKGRDREILADSRPKFSIGETVIFQGEEYTIEDRDDNTDEGFTSYDLDRKDDKRYHVPSDELTYPGQENTAKATSGNQFLQLLNKSNNWVTFFVKSIIQDSAKKGYKKVLFPMGDTAAKVEGHETLSQYKQEKVKRLESLKKEREDRLTIRPQITKQLIETTQRMLDRGIGDKEKLEADLAKYKADQEKGVYTADIDKSIQDLERELEELEGPGGFGALAPVYNFYQNTVANVLKKQGYTPNKVTDAYGNEWNEVTINKERDHAPIMLQQQGTEGSKASPELIAKLKEAAEKMGIKMMELNDYLKGNPEVKVGGINGLADLTQKVIAVAHGHEDVALTEELVHVATAILEQTNPALITAMVTKIDRFKIYKDTLEKYKGLKAYQTASGKPDIRKIKKEAVDKLIAELIVNKSEGSDQFPELTEEKDRTWVEYIWNVIMDHIRNIYSKTNIDVFHTAAEQITEGSVGTVDDIKGEGVFYQHTANAAVDGAFNTIKNYSNDMELRDADPDDRHYLFQGIRVLKSVTEKIKESSLFKNSERTELQKIGDDQKRIWGSRGHEFIEQYIKENLIDKDGYRLANKGTKVIDTPLLYKEQKLLREFAQELINSYHPDTRFIVENMVVDTKTKGMVASTVDFVAIEPHPVTGFKIDTLDWKFTSINKSVADDIPFYKQRDWKKQMGTYTAIWKQYGIKPNQIRKARMIPFIANYNQVAKGNPKLGLKLDSIEIGKLDDVKNTHLYLMPVALNNESTENAQVDNLLSSLRVQYEKLYKRPVGPEEKFAKDLRLNELSRAIRSLHMKLDFEPLVNIGHDFLDNAAKNLKTFHKLDYSTLTKEEIQAKLRSLSEYKTSADKFLTLDNVFLSEFERKNLDDEGKKTLFQLEQIAKRAGNMLKVIEKWEQEYVVQLAIKENIIAEDSENSVLNAEAPVNWISKTMLEASKLPARIINLAANLIMNTNNLVNRRIAKQSRDFGELLKPLEEEAKARGKKAFDLIGKTDKNGIHLIKKFDKEFWTKLTDAQETGDLAYLKSVINKETYDKIVKEFVDKNTQEIYKTKFSSDESKNDKLQEERIKKLKDSVNMNRTNFNGFKSFQFRHILNQSIDEERFYSQEFKDMRKSDAAFNMWNFFTDLNKRAKDMGYLDNKKGLSFMPLIEASILEKFANTSDAARESGDFFRDLYKVKINEEQAFSKTDPETGEIRKEIPKLFVQTDKATSQLTTDLNKMGVMWIEALERYESNKNLEATMEVLLAVEKAKGSLILENNRVMFDESGELKVNLKENKNAAILEAIINDAIYGIKEDLNSFGNVKLKQVASKLTSDEEKQEQGAISFKKVMSNADTLVKTSAVGLKPLIGFANWAGYQFQAFINGGDMYTFKDFQKNNVKIISRMSTLEKALLHSILPLNEDVGLDERRRIAREGGWGEYLKTFSFTDVMMATNSFPERKLQYANAMAFIDNSMVRNGKVVNIRQWVKREDAKKKYERDAKGKLVMSNSERKALEKTYEARVEQMKEAESLAKVSTMDANGEVDVAGVSEEELAKFRTKIIEYGRNLSGQMNMDNKAGFRRDSMLSSFMMFKGWIPKQVHVRGMDLRKNAELDSWEYGRARAFAKTLVFLGKNAISGTRDILNGTEAGLKLLDQMLEEKKAEYYKKTGQHLEITNEEFYDLMRSMITNQFKEIGLLLGVLSLVLAAKAAEPPEDATALEKNRYKWWLKLVNKTTDEVAFYYDPRSTDAIARGSVVPAIGLLSKVWNVFDALGRESYGHIVDDEDITKDAHPTKYILNLMPVGQQFFSEILPYVAPDTFKELGGKVTGESRRH